MNDEQDIEAALDEAIEEILADGDDYDPSTDITPVGSIRAVLTASNVRKLTLFKWKYSLESAGFSSHQAEQLLFHKWMVARQRIGGDYDGGGWR